MTQVEEVTAGDQPSRDGAPSGGRRRRWSRGRLVVVGLAVAALAAVLVFTGGSDDAPEPGQTVDEAEGGAGLLSGLPDGYVSYRDDEAGFSLAHPETWIELVKPQDTTRLVLGVGDGTTLRVQVAELEGAIDASNIDDITAVTSGIVSSPDPKVEKQFLKRDFFSVNGLPGYYYLYALKDIETGEEAVNAVYFVFQGKKMNILIFQSLSAEDFERHAPEFDTILSTFRSDPAQPAE